MSLSNTTCVVCGRVMKHLGSLARHLNAHRKKGQMVGKNAPQPVGYERCDPKSSIRDDLRDTGKRELRSAAQKRGRDSETSSDDEDKEEVRAGKRSKTLRIVVDPHEGNDAHEYDRLRCGEADTSMDYIPVHDKASRKFLGYGYRGPVERLRNLDRRVLNSQKVLNKWLIAFC